MLLKEHRRIYHNFAGDITRSIHPVSYQEKGEGTLYPSGFEGIDVEKEGYFVCGLFDEGSDIP